MISDPATDRDAWEQAEHAHCRCGSRLLPLDPPWKGPICGGCGHVPLTCACRDTCCESCGWGPT